MTHPKEPTKSELSQALDRACRILGKDIQCPIGNNDCFQECFVEKKDEGDIFCCWREYLLGEEGNNGL